MIVMNKSAEALELLAEYGTSFTREIDRDETSVVVVTQLASKLISGYYVLNDDKEVVGKFAYYETKKSSDLLYQTCANDHKLTMLMPKEYEIAIKENLQEQIQHNKGAGFLIEPITP